MTHAESATDVVEPHPGRLARTAAACGAMASTAMAVMTLFALHGDRLVSGTATLWGLTMLVAALTYAAGIWLERRDET